MRPHTFNKSRAAYPGNRREETGDGAMTNFDFEATIASVAAVAITGFYWATLIDVVLR